MSLNKTNIIAIGGLKNSGKNVASKMLQYCLNAPAILRNYWCFKLFSHLNWGKFKIVSFAQPLKEMLSVLLNVPVEKFEDRYFKEHVYINFNTLTLTEHPGDTLSDNKFNKLVAAKDFSFLTTHYITVRQLLQCFGTEIMRNYFGNNLWVLATLNKNNIIISDLRFKVEIDAIKKNNGKIILIQRDSCIPGSHASEKEIIELQNNKGYDYIIKNNKTLKDLFNEIKNIC